MKVNLQVDIVPIEGTEKHQATLAFIGLNDDLTTIRKMLPAIPWTQPILEENSDLLIMSISIVFPTKHDAKLAADDLTTFCKQLQQRSIKEQSNDV